MLELTVASAPEGSDLLALVRQTQARGTELSTLAHQSVAIRIRVAIGLTSTSPGPSVAVLVDGKRVPVINVFGTKRVAQELAIATKVHDAT